MCGRCLSEGRSLHDTSLNTSEGDQLVIVPGYCTLVAKYAAQDNVIRLGRRKRKPAIEVDSPIIANTKQETTVTTDDINMPIVPMEITTDRFTLEISRLDVIVLDVRSRKYAESLVALAERLLNPRQTSMVEEVLLRTNDLSIRVEQKVSEYIRTKCISCTSSKRMITTSSRGADITSTSGEKATEDFPPQTLSIHALSCTDSLFTLLNAHTIIDSIALSPNYSARSVGQIGLPIDAFWKKVVCLPPFSSSSSSSEHSKSFSSSISTQTRILDFSLCYLSWGIAKLSSWLNKKYVVQLVNFIEGFRDNLLFDSVHPEEVVEARNYSPILLRDDKSGSVDARDVLFLFTATASSTTPTMVPTLWTSYWTRWMHRQWDWYALQLYAKAFGRHLCR